VNPAEPRPSAGGSSSLLVFFSLTYLVSWSLLWMCAGYFLLRMRRVRRLDDPPAALEVPA
jgi:hypothetical protein